MLLFVLISPPLLGAEVTLTTQGPLRSGRFGVSKESQRGQVFVSLPAQQ